MCIPSFRRLIVVALLFGATGWAVLGYEQSRRRVTYLRFLSERSECFRRLGSSIKAYAIHHGGLLPPRDEMTALLVNQCVELPTIGVFSARPDVKLRVHEIPNAHQDGNLILAIEQYSGFTRDAIVLYLDGHVTVTHLPAETLEKDAELRREKGLAPIPDR